MLISLIYGEFFRSRRFPRVLDQHSHFMSSLMSYVVVKYLTVLDQFDKSNNIESNVVTSSV